MYERKETTSSTAPDGTSHHTTIIEKSSSGVQEVLLIPIALCLVSVICGLILQVGIKISHSIQESSVTSGGTYTVIQRDN